MSTTENGDKPGIQNAPRVRFPLRWKLSLGASVLAVLPLAVGGALAFGKTKSAVKDASISLQMSIADDVARTLTDEVRPILTALRGTAGSLLDKSLSETERLAVAAYMVSNADALEAAAIYDARGELVDILTSTEADTTAFAPKLSPALRSVVADRESHVVPFEAGGARQLLAVVPLLPHDAAPGERPPSGYVTGFVPVDAIEQRLHRLVVETFPERVDNVYVADLDGLLILSAASPDADAQRSAEMFRQTDLKALRHDLIKSEPFTSAASGPMFGALVARPQHQWAVAVETRQEKAYAPLQAARTAIGLGLLLAALAGLGIALLWSRRLTYPLHALVEQVKRLSKRDFGHRAVVRTNDELALLAGALNEAALDLQEGEQKLIAETEVRHDLARYIPQEVVDAVIKKEHDMTLGGSRREVTVLFADVVAFTSLTERLKPEDTVALLNELFTILTGIVFKHNGTVDKFIGDSVMAIFGAPLANPHHIEDAVACAEDMLTWLEAGNDKWVAQHGTRVELAIGINTGEAIVGNIGSDARMEYTAIGSTVNLAARLEAVARPQQVLVTQKVKAACPDMSFTRIGSERLIRDRDPIDVFALDT